MAETPASDPSLPIFEVHRVGSLSRDRADALELSAIAKTYTELVPITSLEQFRKSAAVAVLPPSDHMIVDRTKFKDMVAKSAKDIAAKTTEASVKRMEASIEIAQKDLATEMGATLSLISDVLATEQASMKASLEKAWESSPNTPEGFEQKRQVLQNAMTAQQATLQRIFDLVIAKKSSLQHFQFRSGEDSAAESTEEAETFEAQ